MHALHVPCCLWFQISRLYLRRLRWYTPGQRWRCRTLWQLLARGWSSGSNQLESLRHLQSRRWYCWRCQTCRDNHSGMRHPAACAADRSDYAWQGNRCYKGCSVPCVPVAQQACSCGQDARVAAEADGPRSDVDKEQGADELHPGSFDERAVDLLCTAASLLSG